MADTVLEAIDEIIGYTAPIYGRSVQLQASSDEYWVGFDKAINLSFIEESDNPHPYRREFRLLRKGYDYAKSIGLITPPDEARDGN